MFTPDEIYIVEKEYSNCPEKIDIRVGDQIQIIEKIGESYKVLNLSLGISDVWTIISEDDLIDLIRFEDIK